MVVLAGISFGYLGVLALIYGLYPGYIDHGEPSILLLSWRLLDGHQVYLPFDAPERTGNVYGPYSFLSHSLFLALFGGSLAVGKTASLLALLLLPPVMAWRYRQDGAAVMALAVLLAVGFALVHTPSSLWNRPDALETLMVAVALAAMGRTDAERDGSEMRRAALIAVAAGIATGSKILAPAYFLPIGLYFAWGNHFFRRILVMAAVGAAVVMAPFLLPVFSLSGLIDWYGPHVLKPVTFEKAEKVLRYMLFDLVPLTAVVAARFRTIVRAEPREAVYVAGLVIGMLLLFPTAAKPGASYNYYYPFTPVVIDVLLRLGALPETGRRYFRSLAVILAGVLLMVSYPIQKRFLTALDWDGTRAAQDEIRAIMKDHPGRTIEIGQGADIDTYKKTFNRTVLGLAGHPYTLDGAIMIESSKMGFALGPGTTDLIRRCATDIWMFPKGDAPFSLIGYYGNQVYSDEFREAFLESYQLAESRREFDVWTCRNRTRLR